jgi:microcin C transport system substrate-binding protein
MTRLFAAVVFICAAFAHVALAAAPADADVKKLVEEAKQVPLPDGIVWETAEDEPLIGAPNAIKGGRLTLAMFSYPLTFRTMGPNSNDSFAGWNRVFSLYFSLVTRHPITDKFIPWMATHWSVQPDQKTIYFKLDRDARFSDGEPITADDYVFTWRMMQSKFIVDPFYNTYVERDFESVDKVDDYTLRIVGKRPSWRPLSDYAGFWPTAAHATVLDDTWIERTNNQPLIVPGPFVISGVVRGESVTFKRVPNWWGDKKRYFTGMFNFDEIHLRLMQPERELDYLRNGEIDFMQEGTSRTWNEGYDFPAIRNGWLRRARIFVDVPQGISGFLLNLKAPILQNRDFRIAMQYLLNFERLNQNVMYNAYFRKTSFFEGTEFENHNLKPYGFDPAKAREHLQRAGFRRPQAIERGVLAKFGAGLRGLIFTRTDTDDILVNEEGQKATFTVTYGSKSFQRHLTVIQQDYRRAGIDMRLQLLEPGTSFERALEGKFEVMFQAMTSGYYPDPRQYLHTDFKDAANSNNFWDFGTKEVDDLIKIYEESLDPQARVEAMHKIDQIVHDEAFYIPFWDAPYHRLVWWDYVQWPEFYLPKRTEQYMDYLVMWIDPQKKQALQEAMRNGTVYPLDPEIDKDYFGIKGQFQ